MNAEQPINATAEDAALAEAEIRAHDRVASDSTLEPIAAVNLLVKVFVAGAKSAVEGAR